jgi:predicted amidophosphoribosyltransferase
MAECSPSGIRGRWNLGYVLDFHTASSTFLGHDEFGHAQFDTVRTPVGELLYRLKNKGDVTVVDELAETAAALLRKWPTGAQVLVPVPPSNPNRLHQPVALVGRRLAELLEVPYDDGVVVKAKATPQLKDVYDFDKRNEILKGAFALRNSVEGKVVLLFDDLYRSGATMNAISELLYEQGNVKEVCVLALTKTRKNR